MSLLNELEVPWQPYFDRRVFHFFHLPVSHFAITFSHQFSFLCRFWLFLMQFWKDPRSKMAEQRWRLFEDVNSEKFEICIWIWKSRGLCYVKWRHHSMLPTDLKGSFVVLAFSSYDCELWKYTLLDSSIHRDAMITHVDEQIYRGIFDYNIGLISISDSVSNQATKISVLNIERS